MGFILKGSDWLGAVPLEGVPCIVPPLGDLQVIVAVVIYPF